MINYDLFLEWCKDRFGEENLKFRKGGAEICTHSFFVDGSPLFPDGDHKFKLWMNPDGGKNNLEGGAYRCWYTDNAGSLISLVSIVDKIPFDQAAERICSEMPLRALEHKVHEFYSNKKPEIIEKPSSILQLPQGSLEISKMNITNFYYLMATEYLNQRKLPCDGLYVCIDGDYKNRIVIPYYDNNKELIYYNCRTLSKNPKILRYMKPKPEEARQTNVLYSKSWPKNGSKIFLTEGEFDAMTLSLIGFNGMACGGKYLSDTQIELLREFKIVLAFDSDDAGSHALTNIGDKLLECGFKDMNYVRPPKIFKDWNKLLEKRDADTLKAYVQKYEKPYTSWTAQSLKSQQI
jgi:hypothetical protein